MGGNVWSNSSRLERTEYFEVASRLPIGTILIASYRSKQTFGDLDALHSTTHTQIIDAMSNVYEVVDYKRNGPATSFQVKLDSGKLFQIDMIRSPEHEIRFSYHYFSWNDCGNLIGRIAHRIGLKFGHDGLWLVQRDKDHVLHTHLLTRDFSEALRYLGLDSDRHFAGFDTPEDIYDFITDSIYFDPKSFELSQRNAASRVRDKKRIMYTNFLKYLNERNLTSYAEFQEKDKYISQHLESFPHIIEKYNKVAERFEVKKQIATKFNGHLVMGLVPLKGKELGAFMSECKRSEWFKDILNLSETDIEFNIKKDYNDHLNMI